MLVLRCKNKTLLWAPTIIRKEWEVWWEERRKERWKEREEWEIWWEERWEERREERERWREEG